MRRVSKPDMVFVCCAYNQAGEYICTFVIEQAYPGGREKRAQTELYNQVQKHLHELNVRTGLEYRIEEFGPPENMRWAYPAERPDTRL